MFKFLSKIGKNKVKSAGVSITEAIVRFDPESATEAAIEMMEENVDSLALEVAKMRQEYDREQLEADTVKEQFNKRIDAVTHMQGQLGGAKGAKKTKLEASINTLLSSVDDMKPDVLREIEEAEDAKTVLDQMETSLEMAATKLKSARGDHKKAQNDMKRAEFKRKNAEATEARTKRLAGISNETDSLSIALTTMKSVANDDLAKADASQRKAKLLKTSDISDDSLIADAMNAVSGAPVEEASISDRVSSLQRL